MARLFNINYGDAHSKRYEPTPISQFLIERDEVGNIVTYNSDVHLLLRQKNLHKSIGLDTIRAYVDSLNKNPDPLHNLSDDELMSLIPPDGIDTITDAYQYQKYVEAHSEHIKKEYKKLQDYKKRQADWKQTYEEYTKSIKSTKEGD